MVITFDEARKELLRRGLLKPNDILLPNSSAKTPYGYKIVFRRGQILYAYEVFCSTSGEIYAINLSWQERLQEERRTEMYKHRIGTFRRLLEVYRKERIERKTRYGKSN